MATKKKAQSSPWLLTLFAVPFAGVGLGFLFFSILPSLYDWVAMQSWQPVQAQLVSAEMRVHHGDDSTTYEATARYRYTVNGVDYDAHRVGIMSGADNVGSWQEERGAALKRSLNSGRPLTVYVDPAQPEAAVIYRDLRWGMLAFKGIFVIVFGGVGLGLIWFVWRADRKTQPEKLATDEPWLAHKDWANPVRSNAKTLVVVLAGFSLFWNALSAPVVFAVPEEWSQGNHAILFALLFPIIGVGLLVHTWVKWRQWRRFGAAPLWLDPWPGSIGGQVGGTVALRLPYDPKQQVQLTLSCIKSFYSGSGKNRQRKEKVVWQADGLADLAPAPEGSKVAFCFDVPENLPSSELPANSYHLWRLDMIAQVPGADFSQQYELPVFATALPSGAARRCASQHPLMQARREHTLEKLLNAKQIPNGIEFYYGLFRRWLGRSVGLFVGTAMTIGGALLWTTDAPVLIALALLIIGALVATFCAFGLLNSYKVKLGDRGLYSERRLLGVLVRKRFVARTDIAGLAIKSTGSSTVGHKHTEHFVVQAHLKNGKAVTVVEDLDGRALAEQALESVALLSGVTALEREGPA